MIGFKLIIPPTPGVTPTETGLTAAMVNDLILCYANAVDPLDVQSKQKLPSGCTYLNTAGAIIPASIINQVYADMDNLMQVIICVGIGNYWITTNPNVLGTIPANTTIFATNTNTVFQRHFFQPGSWTYINCAGSIPTLTTFINNALTTFLTVNGGVYATVLTTLQAIYNTGNTTTL